MFSYEFCEIFENNFSQNTSNRLLLLIRQNKLFTNACAEEQRYSDVSKRWFPREIKAKASPVFLCQIFVNSIQKEHVTKYCRDLVRFHKVIKFQSFAFSACDVEYPRTYKSCHLWFFLHNLLTLWRKHLEVAKFWTIELYICVSDVIHANEQTKYVNCGSHVTFCNFL